MELMEAVINRRSIRKFLPEQVPTDLIATILEAARWAPSGGNRQPGRFIVVTDKEKIRQFDPYFHQSCVETAPAVIIACADPHVTWEKYDEDDICYRLDVAAAIENILLAIHDCGLGGVWVISCSKRDIRKLIGIPSHWEIIAIIPFGYFNPKDNKQKITKKPLEEIAFLENPDNPLIIEEK